MKATVSFLAAAALAIMAGCASGPRRGTLTIEPWSWTALERARGSELIMACGVAEASAVSGAIEKAKQRSRAELAWQLEKTVVDTMVTDLARETGEEGLHPPEAYIADVKRTVVAWSLANDAVFRGLRSWRNKDGTTTVKSLAVFDPRVLVEAFATHAEKSAGWYARFKSSATYAALEQQVARYVDYIAEGP